MSTLPTPLRAALGLALTAVDTVRDTAKTLPQKAVGLPVSIVSNAVQLSLRAQQHYAALTNKGDELIGAFRGVPDEPPAWAQFDGPPTGETPSRNTAFDRVTEEDLADLEQLDDLEQLNDLEVLDDLADELVEELAGSDTALQALVEAEIAFDTALDDDLSPAVVPAAVEQVMVSDGARITEPREPEPAEPVDSATAAATRTAAARTADKATPVRSAKKATKKAARKATAPKKATKVTTLEGDPLPPTPFAAGTDAPLDDEFTGAPVLAEPVGPAADVTS